MTRLPLTIAASTLLLVGTFGCRQHTHSPDAAWQPVAEEDMTTEQAVQREKALAARDAMFDSLKGRLLEVIGSEGPAAAIEVCSKEAPRIAARVSDEHSLMIGRTSFRLRNQANAPPPWAAGLVEDRTAEPIWLAKNGKLAALLPIRMQPACLTCHGPQEGIPPEVKSALARHYPHDRATGFQDGELRGWFFVEVPADDS